MKITFEIDDETALGRKLTKLLASELLEVEVPLPQAETPASEPAEDKAPAERPAKKVAKQVSGRSKNQLRDLMIKKSNTLAKQGKDGVGVVQEALQEFGFRSAREVDETRVDEVWEAIEAL